MRAELIRVEQSVFVWRDAQLWVAELDDDGRPGPTRALLSGVQRPASFAGRMHAIVGRERLTLDPHGSVLERSPVIGPPIDAVLAWLAPEAAIVERDGQPRLCRLDVDASIPITPAFFGLAHSPLVRALDRRLLWAQSGVHLGVVDFDRSSRPQPLGGVERLAWSPTSSPIGLWIDAGERHAALLGDDGRVERFDLDTGRSVAVGWLPSGACAAAAELDRFVVVDGRTAGWVRPRPTRETTRSGGWLPGPAAVWLDAEALLILADDQLSRVELAHHW